MGLGVTGGIAAYKAVELCRLLVDAGAHVAPVLTRAATEFVGVATFSALASELAQTEITHFGSQFGKELIGAVAIIQGLARVRRRGIRGDRRLLHENGFWWLLIVGRNERFRIED